MLRAPRQPREGRSLVEGLATLLLLCIQMARLEVGDERQVIGAHERVWQGAIVGNDNLLWERRQHSGGHQRLVARPNVVQGAHKVT